MRFRRSGNGRQIGVQGRQLESSYWGAGVTCESSKLLSSYIGPWGRMCEECF